MIRLGELSYVVTVSHFILHPTWHSTHLVENKETRYCSSVLAKAEYRVMANATSKVVWLRKLLTSLGFSVPPAIMHCYNQVALCIATNLFFMSLPSTSKCIVILFIKSYFWHPDYLLYSYQRTTR